MGWREWIEEAVIGAVAIIFGACIGSVVLIAFVALAALVSVVFDRLLIGG